MLYERPSVLDHSLTVYCMWALLKINNGSDKLPTYPLKILRSVGNTRYKHLALHVKLKAEERKHRRSCCVHSSRCLSIGVHVVFIVHVHWIS